MEGGSGGRGEGGCEDEDADKGGEGAVGGEGMGWALPVSGASVSNTLPPEKSAFSLRNVLDGALVFLRGLSRVLCSSLGLSCATSRMGFGLGGGAGTFTVYIVWLATSICRRALKLGNVSSSRSCCRSNEGGGLLGGGGGESSSDMAAPNLVASFPGRFLRGREKTAWAPLFAHAWDIP